MEADRLARYTDIGKNLAQIAALIVAAIWTYLLFIRTEEPSLELRSRTHSSLEWRHLDDNRCIANFRVEHENIGRTSYNVVSFHWRVWEFKPPDSGKTVEYMDLQTLQKRQPLLEQVVPNEELESGPFLNRYPPGAAFGHNFEWVVEREPFRFLFFRLDLAVDGSDSDNNLHAGSWGVACEGLPAIKPVYPGALHIPRESVAPPKWERDR